MNTNSAYIRGSMEKQHFIKKKKKFSTIWHQAFFLCIISIVNKQTRKKKTIKRSFWVFQPEWIQSAKQGKKAACALFVCIQLISSVMFLFPWTIAVTFCFKCARTSFTCCPSCVISCPTLMCCTCVQLSSRSHAIQVSRVPFVLCQIHFFSQQTFWQKLVGKHRCY